MGWIKDLFKTRSEFISVSNPAAAWWFGGGTPNYSGVNVGEATALSISAVWRACSLISGTIASLPMRTIREVDGTRTVVSSFLDDPGGPNGPTPFEWRETVLLHLLLHGNAFLAHVFNGAGTLAALVPVHPLAVTVEWERDAQGLLTGRKLFKANLNDGRPYTFTHETMTHIPAQCTDGLRGLSPIEVARNSLGTAIAGERAAAKMFSNGALHAGMVTSDEDVDEEEAEAIRSALERRVSGWENAGEIAFINRKLTFSPWTMSMEDAQFLQSRQFQIEEIARWYGIPPYELMQTEKQTSWGTGIEAQQRGLARQVLGPWTNRLEQRLSRLLATPRFIRFDFAGLERPTPEQEIALLIQQVGAGLITVNEARKIRGMDPITGGDELRNPSGNQPNPLNDVPTVEALR